jgi:hypothetical protein
MKNSIFATIAALLLSGSYSTAYAQINCYSLDQEQQDINDYYRALRSRYSITTSFHSSCLRDSRAEADIAGCEASAIIMAGTCPFGECTTSSNEYTQILWEIRIRYRTLNQKKSLANNCQLSVPNIFELN